MEMKGMWNGLMHDAEGHKAHVELELDQAGKELSGEVCYTPISTHKEKEIRGPVSGTVRDDRVSLKFELRDDRSAQTVTFEGQVREVKVHARAALLGRYDVSSDRSQTLAGGVGILWLYEDQK